MLLGSADDLYLVDRFVVRHRSSRPPESDSGAFGTGGGEEKVVATVAFTIGGVSDHGRVRESAFAHGRSSRRRVLRIERGFHSRGTAGSADASSYLPRNRAFFTCDPLSPVRCTSHFASLNSRPPSPGNCPLRLPTLMPAIYSPLLPPGPSSRPSPTPLPHGQHSFSDHHPQAVHFDQRRAERRTHAFDCPLVL